MKEANQIQTDSGPPANVLNDQVHTYTWDANGNSITLDTVGATFDALDRMVEQNPSGVYTEIVYSPTGAKLALMSGANGQTLQKGFVQLPGQATAIYTGSGLDHYRHSDWLGSARLTSSPTRTVLSTTAYAPFGDTYAQSGTADPSFTGENSDTVSGDYDFLYREYSTQGRWPSPDPAGAGAADPMVPQSWNRYAYVLNNPLSWVDPLGLHWDCVRFIIGGEISPNLTCIWVNDPIPGAPSGCVAYGTEGCIQAPSTTGGGGAAPNNGRQPNKITCGTVLPNGQTVGSYVNQLSNQINNAGNQSVSTPYGPASAYTPGLSPLSIPGAVYSGTNFRKMFGGPGANYALLGDAGNFAYAAVSANIGVPLWATEAAAGAYSVLAHPSSDWVGPWGMDPSATVQVPAGYGAGCKSQ